MTATPISRATQLRYALVRSAQDCNDVYRLRHASYLRNASIDPVPGGGFSDGFDADPNNFSFLVRSATAPPFATVRITVVRPDLGWTDSPAQHMFRDHPALR